MARRESPWQGDLFTVVALEYTAPRDALAAEVLEAIEDVLPPGVPTYVREVRSVVRNPKGEMIATLVVFDGQSHDLAISGQKGARGYRWLPPFKVPFGWDEAVKAWRRYPEDAEENA